MAKHRPSVVELQEVLWDMPRVYSDEELELFLNCETAKIIDTEADVSEDQVEIGPEDPEGKAEAEQTIKDQESRIEAQGKVGEELEQKVKDLEAALEDQAKVSEDLSKQVADAKQLLENAESIKAAADELQKKCDIALEQLTASEVRDETINPLLGQVFKLKTVLSVAEKEALPEDTQATLTELFGLCDKLDIGPKTE